MRILISSVAFLFLFLISCQKEASEDLPDPESTCRISKTYSYFEGEVDDSILYTYSGSQISKVEVSNDFYFTPVYENNKVTRRNYFLFGSSVMVGYDKITYHADGTIHRIEEYQVAPGGDSLMAKTELTYTSGRITKSEFYYEENGSLKKESETRFTYTGENISRAEVKIEPVGNTPAITYTVNYTYDNQPNQFGRNAQVLLTNAVMLSETSFFVPFVLSANNVSKMQVLTEEVPFEYIRDSKGNVTEMRAEGELWLKNTYHCE